MTANLQECHVELLERFQIRSNLVVPLFKNQELWGLLCIHQCLKPRHWQTEEIEFVREIAAHLDVALQQAEYVRQIKETSQNLAEAVSQAVEREQAIATIVSKIRRSLDLQTIFQTTTKEVRSLLNADRVGIYRFNPIGVENLLLILLVKIQFLYSENNSKIPN
jgi:two-component system, sensor histidine kinase and response regulator